jgi:hypothetical protein
VTIAPPIQDEPKDLKIQRTAKSAAAIENEVQSDLDEIFIDVRGNLHHKGDLASASMPEGETNQKDDK